MPTNELTESDRNNFREINAVITNLPPGFGSFAVPPVQQYSGILNTINKFFRNPDEAVRQGRENSRNMLRSLMIREPLQARILATAELEGHVEPANRRDPKQLAIASELDEIIRDEIPNFLKLKIALLWGCWWGKSGVLMKYRYDYTKNYRRLVCQDWTPVHGDSIKFKWSDERVAILTGIWGNAQGPGTKTLTVEPSDEAPSHVLEPWERSAFILHTHDHLPGDYFEPEASGGIKGLGIRDALYWTWYLCHELTGWLVEFMERVGTGVTLYKYIRGNQASFESMKTLAETNSFQGYLLIPVDPETTGQTSPETVERMEPSAVGIDNMMKVLDEFFGSQIRRYIVGQDATSRAVPSGLNSDTGRTHENTFNRIVRMDAMNLEQTLTRELVAVLQRWTFPDLPYKCSYKLAVDRPNVKETLESAKAFFDMGGEIDQEELRGIIGLSKPDEGAVVLKKQENTMFPGLGEFGDEQEKLDDKSKEGPPKKMSRRKKAPRTAK